MRVEHQQGELAFGWRDPLHNTPLAGLSCIAAGEGCNWEDVRRRRLPSEGVSQVLAKSDGPGLL